MHIFFQNRKPVVVDLSQKDKTEKERKKVQRDACSYKGYEHSEIHLTVSTYFPKGPRDCPLKLSLYQIKTHASAKPSNPCQSMFNYINT